MINDKLRSTRKTCSDHTSGDCYRTDIFFQTEIVVHFYILTFGFHCQLNQLMHIVCLLFTVIVFSWIRHATLCAALVPIPTLLAD